MSSAIAVSIVPGELRLMVARANGAVKPLHQLAAALLQQQADERTGQDVAVAVVVEAGHEIAQSGHCRLHDVGLIRNRNQSSSAIIT